MSNEFLDFAPNARGRLSQSQLRGSAVKAAGGSKRRPLRWVRTTVPWRASSGKSWMIHPLRVHEFFERHFGQHAVVFKRGPLHPIPLKPSGAAGMLRGFSLGIDADIMEHQTWAHGRPSVYGPERGMPALAALSRGKPVRLNRIDRRAPHLFRREPLVAALKRLAPGRGIGGSLFWTPPGVMATSAHEDWYDQLVMQVYGTRRWTVCTRGTSPAVEEVTARAASGDRSRSLQGNCTAATLRRGDALYLPSQTWHWTSTGPKASAHLNVGVTPLVGADFLVALGALDRMIDMGGHAALGLPLPLWGHAGGTESEGAVEAVTELCYRLPWADIRDASVLCAPVAVRIALQRLSHRASDKRPPHDQRSAGSQSRSSDSGNGPKSRWARRGRGHAFSEVVRSVGRPAAELLLLISGLLFLMWICAALTSNEPQKRTERRRVSSGGGARATARRAAPQKSRAAKKAD